jgi:hypothetical protein
VSRVATATVEPPPEPAPSVRHRPRPVLHPFLFTIFPIVFLVARNTTDDIGPREVLEPLALALAVAAFVFAGLWIVFRDPHPAGFFTSGLVLLFFSFGHVNALRDPNHLDIPARKLFIAYVLVALVLLLITVQYRRRFARLTPGLNLIAGVLVVLNLVPIAVAAAPHPGGGVIGSDVQLTAPAHPRDVYYIIFDRYADETTLRDRYGYDNTPFLDSLGDRGFDVVTDAVANYPKTAHSLASSLNMSFLDQLVAEQGVDTNNWRPIYQGLQNFQVARALERIGYTYDHIGSWWSPTHDDPTADRNYVYGRGEFSQTLLETTIWPVMSGTVGIADLTDPELTQYNRVGFQFDALNEIEADPDPTFTFAHFTLPHPPYVFDAQGNYVAGGNFSRGSDAAYLEQLKYTNTAMLQMIDRLLAGPEETDPIVVIQSDEGPHPVRLEQDEDAFEWPDATDAELGGKFRILDAVYLPGEGPDAHLESFTPVNTFRIVFDRYFGADLPLLPDRSWVFQDSTHPYRFTEITDRLATLQT